MIEISLGCKSPADPSKVNALLRELSADSDDPLDAPTTHGAVVPKASEPEEFEEEEEEEEEEDRKQYCITTLPETNICP